MTRTPGRWVWTGLLALSLIASAGAAEQTKLTLAAQGVVAQKVVADLAAQSGQDLTCSPELAREVLLISVNDAPVEELLTRIATVLGAEWRTEPDGGCRLAISASKAAAESRAEREARTAAFRKRFQEIREGLKRGEELERKIAAGKDSPETEGDDDAKGWELIDEEAAMARIVLKLDPAFLAGIGEDERVVFATAPTRMQRPISGIEREIATLIAEHNDAVKAAAAAEAEPAEMNEEMRQAMEWAKLMGFDRERKRIDVAPAKALLIVSRGGSPFGFVFGGLSALEATLRLYDANGKVLLEQDGHGLLDVDDSMREMLADMQDIAQEMNPNAPPKPVEDGPKIEYSQTTQELRKAMRMENMANMTEQKLSAELVERITRPDLHDPLSFEPAESVLAVAKAKNAMVVANLPDAMADGGMFGMVRGTAPTVDDFWQELQKGDTRAEIKDGWLMVWPASLRESRLERQDRVALAQLIGAARAKGLPTLDDMAAYAAVNDSPSNAPVAMTYTMLFAPNMISSGMAGMVDWNLLRFYGRLSQSQRDMLRRGGQIPLFSFEPRIRELIDKMTFGVAARLRLESAAPKPSGGPFLDMIQDMVPSPHTEFLQEPTEAMPNGLPNTAAVALRIKQDYAISMTGFGGRSTGAQMSMGPEEVAMMRYFMEDPQFAAASAMMPKIDKVKIGQREKLDFRFVLAPRVYTQGTLLDDRFPKGDPDTPFANLPAPLEARIQEIITALKKSPLPMLGGMGMGAPNARP